MPNSNKDILLITAAMFAGCISHLLYDTFNPQGIMWLHPIKKKRYSLANIDTSSAAELSFRVFMIVITIAMLVVINPFSNISFEISPITIPDLSGHGFH